MDQTLPVTSARGTAWCTGKLFIRSSSRFTPPTTPPVRRSSNVSSSKKKPSLTIHSNSVLRVSRGSSWPYGCIAASIIASVSDEVFQNGGGSAGGGGGCTSSCGMGTSPMTTKPKTSREILDAEKPSWIRFCWHLNKCLHLRPSQPGQLCILVFLDLASSASRVVLSVSLERDFHHALPPEHVTSSTGTTFSGPKLPPLSQLGCWLLSTAADDHCALATVGSGKFGTGFGVVLTPSLPTCSGAPEIAGTTITSLCSTVCLVTVCASPAAASARRPATGVHLMATTKLDSSRSDVGKRRIVRATTMPNIVPMRCVLLVRDRPNHKPYTHLLLNFAGWSVGSFHMTRSAEK